MRRDYVEDLMKLTGGLVIGAAAGWLTCMAVDKICFGMKRKRYYLAPMPNPHEPKDPVEKSFIYGVGLGGYADYHGCMLPDGSFASELSRCIDQQNLEGVADLVDNAEEYGFCAIRIDHDGCTYLFGDDESGKRAVYVVTGNAMEQTLYEMCDQQKLVTMATKCRVLTEVVDTVVVMTEKERAVIIAQQQQ